MWRRFSTLEEKVSKKRSRNKGDGETSNSKTNTLVEKKITEKKKEPTTPTVDKRLASVIEQVTAKEFNTGKVVFYIQKFKVVFVVYVYIDSIRFLILTNRLLF